MLRQNIFLLLFILAGLSSSGCNEHPELVPVSGTVTIDGKPVPIGQVKISTPGHRAAVGSIDKNGKFALTSYKLNDGAPIGTHRVTVTAVEQLTETSNRWHAPIEYANQVATDLEVTIDGPTDSLNIELTWEGSDHDGPYIDRF
ncbi:MAG: carboxypeptidase-like regulatory domain-containing protein [Lacipirellulaceae bacterium]